MSAPNTGTNAAPGYINQASQQFQGLSTFYKILFAIFLIIVIGYLVYWGVTSRGSATLSSRMNPVIISKPINAFDSTASEYGITLPVSNQGLEFTYSFWIYVADWSFNYGRKKYIFIKGRPDDGPERWAPAIWLGEKLNTLHTSMSVYPSSGNPFQGVEPSAQYESCMVRDIPLQKWVYVSYVLNNRNVDIYIDGKLEKSCMLDAVPDVNNRPLHITPRMPQMPGEAKTDSGFYGHLSAFSYHTRALQPNDISDIYFRGPYAYA